MCVYNDGVEDDKETGDDHILVQQRVALPGTTVTHGPLLDCQPPHAVGAVDRLLCQQHNAFNHRTASKPYAGHVISTQELWCFVDTATSKIKHTVV